MACRRIPWHEIQLKYVTDPSLSLRRLAREYSIDYSNLQRRAKREDWDADRGRHQRQTKERVQEETIEDLKEATLRNLCDVRDQARRIRQAYGQRLLRTLDEDADPAAIEETQTATKNTGGTSVRRSTRKKKQIVNARGYAQLVEIECRVNGLIPPLLSDSNDGPPIRIV